LPTNTEIGEKDSILGLILSQQSITWISIYEFRKKSIKEKGYWAWYYKNNFGRRNKVENTFYRLKTIFGRKLHSRTLPNQDTESLLSCYLLNKMTNLGMPKSVKTC